MFISVKKALDKSPKAPYYIDVLKNIYVLADMTIDCVEFCKALADDTRQGILMLLLEGEMSAGEIVDAFTISQPTVSHHLNVLKRYGLVTSRREGQHVFYAINQNNIVACCGRLIAKFDGQEVEETDD